MKIGLASDHAGFPLKEYVKQYLTEKGIEYVDYGTDSEASCDYPDYGHALANGLERKECHIGIAVCGSGEGISMTLNKHAQVRAALVWMPEIAHLARQHNDANILALGGRVVGPGLALKIVETFLTTPFSGDERHIRRIRQIEA